jgi:NADH dehydrogenase FAD-containing subunit
MSASGFGYHVIVLGSGFGGVWRRSRGLAIGDVANIPDHDGNEPRQLGSVALREGRWAADNIFADRQGKPHRPFDYKDSGIMAMIGTARPSPRSVRTTNSTAMSRSLARRARPAEERRPPPRRRSHRLAWDLLGSTRASSIIDDPDLAQIDWGTEVDDETSGT